MLAYYSGLCNSVTDSIISLALQVQLGWTLYYTSSPLLALFSYSRAGIAALPSVSKPCMRFSYSHGSWVNYLLSLAPWICETQGLYSHLTPLHPTLRYFVHFRLIHSLLMVVLVTTLPTLAYLWAFPRALAFWGILPDNPCGWLPTLIERTSQVTSFPDSVWR
jgi:hypothetical protein